MLTYIHNFRPSVTAGRWYYFWVRHMWFVCLWVHHLLKTFCSHRRHMQRIRDFLVIVGSTSLLFTFFTFTKLVRSTLSKDESVSWPYGLLWERTKCPNSGEGYAYCDSHCRFSCYTWNYLFLFTADISPNNESGIITDGILTTYQIVPCEMLGNCSRKMAPVFTAHSTSLLKHQCSKAWLSVVIWLLVCNSSLVLSS